MVNLILLSVISRPPEKHVDIGHEFFQFGLRKDISFKKKPREGCIIVINNDNLFSSSAHFYVAIAVEKSCNLELKMRKPKISTKSGYEIQ